IGAGGMGEVYRARDTKVHRDVAIKVLPDLFARDPERLARFEREARTHAALNHPNIAHVYGVEGSALIMERVDGEDLSQRIARGHVGVRMRALRDSDRHAPLRRRRRRRHALGHRARGSPLDGAAARDTAGDPHPATTLPGERSPRAPPRYRRRTAGIERRADR